jgi:hypothetical protein
MSVGLHKQEQQEEVDEERKKVVNKDSMEILH